MENEGTCDIVPVRSAKSPENSSEIPGGEVLVLTCYYTNGRGISSSGEYKMLQNFSNRGRLTQLPAILLQLICDIFV